MSVIKIENFGGEMPSMSPRSLPATGAQVNNNLYLGTNEFRPLKDVGARVSGVALRDSGLNGGVMRSMYLVPGSATWHASTYERSFVRTPINDAGLDGRTYLTTDEPSLYPTAFSGIDLSSERRLGVPAPASIATELVTNGDVNLDSAWNNLQKAADGVLVILRDNRLKSGEPMDRFADLDGAGPQDITIFGGTRTANGLNIPWASDNPNVPLNLRERWWQLSFGATAAKVSALGLDTTLLGAVWDDTLAKHFIPISALPYTYRLTPGIRAAIKARLLTDLTQPELPLAAVMTEATSDDVLAPLLTDAQAEALLDQLAVLLDVETLCRSQRDELTALVQEFSWLLADESLDFGDAVAPTVVTVPDYPVGEQYTVNDEGNTVRSAEWVAYDEALRAYQDYQRATVLYDGKVDYVKAAQNNKIYNIQLRAAQVTREIENILDARWTRLSTDSGWIKALFDAQGGPTAFTELDYLNGTGKENRFYLATFVTDWGEESAPSPVSAWHYTGYRDWVQVTAPTVPPGRGITGWRLYRNNSGTAQTSYQLVPLAETDEQASKANFKDGVFDSFKLGVTFNDKVQNTLLGELLPSLTWLEPPAGLRGLVSMPNGIMAGFVGNTVHFCEPFVPYAWPFEYEVTTDAQIVGLGVFGQTLVVTTTANPYYISGADSASMSSVKMDANQSCASRRSIASVQGGVLYASPDGLCAADSSGVSLVSQGLFTREDWQQLGPSSMFGIEHESVYYLFYKGAGGGCLTFDMASKKLGRVGNLAGVTAAFVDRESDTLYAAISNEIKPLHGAATCMTAEWKSPKISFAKQEPLAWLKVVGEQTSGSSALVRWYADGALRHTATVTSVEPSRLPSGRWLEHEIEIESNARITQVLLAGSTQELQST